MERNKAIDSVAGILITYMVFTHFCQHFGYERSTIYMALEHIFYFFMPWFFFKAGMFFKMEDYQTLFKKSCTRLIRPFILYSLIGHICYCGICYLQGNFHLSTLVPYYSLLMEGSIPGNLPLWFLLTLFACRIIFNFLQKKEVSVYLIAFVSLLFAFGLHLIGFKHPFYIASTLIGLFFMSVGYVCSNKTNENSPILLICLLIYVLSQWFPSFVGMRSNHLYYGVYILWILYSVCGIVLMNFVGYKFLNNTKLLSFLGKYSMEIYCLHWIPLLFL